MALIERALQKYAVKGVTVDPNTKVELLRLSSSTKEQFVLLTINVTNSGGAKVSDIEIEIKRVIGTREQLINPPIKSDFFPVKLGEIFLGIRGDVPERYKEGLVIPENSSLVVTAYNPTGSSVSLNCEVEYIRELYEW